MQREEKLLQIEMEYMEQFERGEAPTLEELVERFPDLRNELVDFVLDFVTLENAAEQTELSEEEARSVAATPRAVHGERAQARRIFQRTARARRQDVGGR